MTKDGIKSIIAEMIAAEVVRGNIRNAAALQYAFRAISKERPRYAYLAEAKGKKLRCTNCGKKYKPGKATPYCGGCGCKFLGGRKNRLTFMTERNAHIIYIIYNQCQPKFIAV